MSATYQILQDFPTVSAEKWKELFLKETKQETIQAHYSYLGFDFLPFYTAQNQYPEQASLLQQLSTGRDERWYITRQVEITDAASTNKKIQAALNKGVSSITLKGDLTNEKETAQILNEVLANYIEINFQGAQSNQTTKQYIDWCKKQASTEKVFGAVYNDPLGEALKNGGWKNGKEKDLEILVENFLLTEKETAKIKSITIDAAVYHYAGASLVQTIAYTLAHALEYISFFQAKNMEPARVIERMVVKWPVGTSFFAEIAALRALRLLWHNLCTHLTGNPQHLYKASIHAETSVYSWSVADMYNNLLRATTQSMSAIAGGATSVCVQSYNVVSTDANEFSERLAANIQLLLREESFFGKVADPAAGSYLVEELTHQLAERSLDLLKKIEAAGGLLKLVQEGSLQQQLAQNMEQMSEAVRKGEIKILGANLYPDKNENLDAIPKKDLFNFQPTGTSFVPLKMQRLASVLEKK